MKSQLVDGSGCRLRDIFSGRPFKLDYFQRAYVWNPPQVRCLIEDLISCFIEEWSPRHRPEHALTYTPYFLGPFVSYVRDGERYLADGQQRIITLTLLMLRLRRLAKEQELPDTAFNLEFLVAKPAIGGRIFAIDVEDYRHHFEGIWSGSGSGTDAQDPNVSHFHKAYEELSVGLSADLPDEALEHFVIWLLDRVSLVEIDAKDHRRAWKIFQSMNCRGVKLEPIDFLKGYFLSDSGSSRMQVEATWQRMFKRLERIDKQTPPSFMTTVLRALYSDIEPVSDAPDLTDATHEWVRLHEKKIWPSLREGDRSEFVISTLDPLSKVYVRLLTAAREFEPALPSVYFNSRHRLETQFELMLACCRPGETERMWLPKAKLVADFVDFLFVLHGVNNDILTDLDLRQMSTRLLPQLCKAVSPADVQTILATEHDGFDMELSAALELRCRSDNKAFVRYLLARITAWLDLGAQRGDFIAQYLELDDSGVPRFEIEHMYPNAFHTYGHVTQTEYTLQRTRFGALLLLDGSTNSGLGGLSLEDKIHLYHGPSGNLLAASLHPATYERGNAKFKRFVKAEQLHTRFTYLPPDHEMLPFVEQRCGLYQAMVERIWDPIRIGILPAKPQPPSKSGPRTRRSYGVEFGELVRSGLIVDGDVLSGTLLGKSYSATVLADGRIRTHSGGAFDSPSRAAMDTLERMSSNGWTFWHLKRTGVRIDSIRDAYLARS